MTSFNHSAMPVADTPVIVGLSGGVDSAVAALLLRDQGLQVRALFMKNWEEDDDQGHCAATEDADDARAVCKLLGIDFHSVNFSSEYWDLVFERFLAAYRAGLTPNPDVLCNREIKFHHFLRHALDLGGEYIATGHYARKEQQDGVWRLLKAEDLNKDQSYFLHAIDQRALAHTLFPLGTLKKGEVRRLAKAVQIPVHAKKDSTGICFIGERPFREFLGRYLAPNPGPMETPEGETMGRHDGLMYYTLGQRRGLGIGGRAGSNGAPWYVAAKDEGRNTLIVVQDREHALLYSHELEAGELHWIAGKPPALPLECHAKTRYRQPDQACRVTALADGRIKVCFAEAQWAVTPGQSVVFYSGDACLGGGTIESARA